MKQWWSAEQFAAAAAKSESTEGIGIRKAAPVSVEDAEGDRRLTFTISTDDVDHERDIIAVDGWNLAPFKGTGGPMLWAHDYSSPPIGRAVKVWKEDHALKATFEFVSAGVYPFADMIYQLYKGGFMRSVSVGFKPDEHSWDESRHGMNFSRQTLLEVSACPVPANPHAVLDAKAAGVDVEPLRAWAEKTLAALGASPVLTVKTRLGDMELLPFVQHTEPTGAVWTMGWGPQSVTLPNQQTATSGFIVARAAECPAGHDCPMADTPNHADCPKGNDCPMPKALADAATRGMTPPSPSGYGLAEEGAAWRAPSLKDFTETGWDDLSDAEKRRIARHYTWAASMPPETFGDLKLPHHRAADGDAVWRGVAAAMAVLLGGRGGVEMPEADRAKAHRHLAAHYLEWDKKPPEMGRAYSPEELERIADEPATTACQPVASAAAEDEIDLDAITVEEEDEFKGLAPEDVLAALREVIGTETAAGVWKAVNSALGRVD